jgi:hypothetical protein
MAYTVYRSDGTSVIIPDDVPYLAFYNPIGGGGFGPGNVPVPGNGLGPQLLGRNTTDYGGPVAQTLLQMTENFCSSVVPADAYSLQGQLWFNQSSITTGNLYVRITTNPSGGISNWSKVISLNPGTGMYDGLWAVNGNETISGTVSVNNAILGGYQAAILSSGSALSLQGNSTSATLQLKASSDVWDVKTGISAAGDFGIVNETHLITPIQIGQGPTPTINLNNNTSITGGLTVGPISSLAHFLGNATVDGTLTVNGTFNIAGNFTAGGYIAAGNGLYATGGVISTGSTAGPNTPQTTGNVALFAGDASHTGLIGFYDTTGTREGFLGSSNGSSLTLSSDALATLNIISPNINALGNLTITNVLQANSNVNIDGILSMAPGETIQSASGNLYMTAGSSGILYLGANGTPGMINLDTIGNLNTGPIIAIGTISGTANQTTTMLTSTVGLGGVWAYNPNANVNNGGAFMAFNRGNVYAVYAGLDNDNSFKIGGWNDGTQYRFSADSSGNLTVRGNLTVTGGTLTGTTFTGNAATSTLATKASTLANGGGAGSAMTFGWVPSVSQPTWIWGTNNSASNSYVYNPANINVGTASALSAPSALPSGTTATTQPSTDNTTKVATTAFAQSIANITGWSSSSTYHNVTGSRSTNVTYTNSTGKVMMVHVLFENFTGSGDAAEAYVQGVLINWVSIPAGFVDNLTFIVPSGYNYEIAPLAHSSVTSWLELY